MNKEETLKALLLSTKQYNLDCENARKEKDKRNFNILQAWASENNRFNIGDIIECNGGIIKIEQFRGVYSNYYEQKLYITYIGACLTKKLQPKKDGTKLAIYDDGREVKLIKKA